jgi:hypothetical protein
LLLLFLDFTERKGDETVSEDCPEGVVDAEIA